MIKIQDGSSGCQRRILDIMVNDTDKVMKAKITYRPTVWVPRQLSIRNISWHIDMNSHRSSILRHYPQTIGPIDIVGDAQYRLGPRRQGTDGGASRS